MRVHLLALVAVVIGCANATECVKNTDCTFGLICNADGTCGPPTPGVPDDFCSSCQSNSECETSLGRGALCLQIGPNAATFCAIDCSNTECPDPDTMDCLTAFDPQGTPLGKQCLPKSDDCACTALTPDTQSQCINNNEFGTCTGTATCNPELGFLGCNAATPAREICDGVDNDCDGIIDGTDTDDDGISDIDPVDVGVACGINRAPCQQGTLICQNGSPICQGSIDPQADRCDGVDNDCDGFIDATDSNGDGSPDTGASDDGTACGTDEGACTPGVLLCQPDPTDTDGDGIFAEFSCQNQIGPTTEICNNLDDDCDAQTDEISDVGTQTCGLGVCENTVSACATCTPLNNSSSEVCDGLDNNCNGQDDEGLGSITCGLGICQNTVFACVDGVSQVCDPFPPNATDFPDPGFIDSDCDGIDGELDNAIFVSPVGVDTVGCGALNNPCASIQVGIDEAVSQVKRDVYVAGGTYNGGTFFMANGVNVFGGFGSNFQRDPAIAVGNRVANVTGDPNVEITPGEFQAATVVANGLTQPTILADMTLRGVNTTQQLANGTGKSSYVIIVRNVPTGVLTIQRNVIVAGNGANGSNGSNGQNAATVAAQLSMNGSDGVRGGETGGVRTGPNGGTNTCPSGSGVNGGKGGNGGDIDGCGGTFNLTACPGQNGGNGAQAGGAFGNGGGAGAASGSVAGNGNPGQNGKISNGAAGLAGTAGGRLVGEFWYGKDGSDGGIGDNGGGGGGGGGGGASDNNIDDYGSSGGSGAAGGCRAVSAGTAGKGGGGSFAIFLINASPSIQQNSITRGNGGKGGNGGNGGQGQNGGSAGAGATDFEDGGAGGDGGKGGHGGHGGGAGGAAGGIVFAIYKTSAASVPTLVGNTFSAGSAGNFGTGGISAPSATGTAEDDGNDGPSGAAGVVGDAGTCTAPGGC